MLIDWLERNLVPCFYKKYFGIECPGCGMQRALIALLKGNLVESFKLYPALIPIIAMFIYLILHIILKFENGALWLKRMFIINVIIIIFSYIYKIT